MNKQTHTFLYEISPQRPAHRVSRVDGWPHKYPNLRGFLVSSSRVVLRGFAAALTFPFRCGFFIDVIVPQLAAQFICAYMAIMGDR